MQPQPEPQPEAETQTHATKKAPPLDRATSGAVELPVWVNRADDGTEFANPGKIVRVYRDDQGNRQTTEFLRDRDLLDVAFVCEEAHRIIGQYRKEQAEAKRDRS